MPNRYFQQIWNLLIEEFNVIQTQIMSGVDSESEFIRAFGCQNIGIDRIFIAESVLMRKSLGIQFNPVGTEFRRTFNHLEYRIDKNRSPNAIPLKFLNDLTKKTFMRHGVPACI